MPKEIPVEIIADTENTEVEVVMAPWFEKQNALYKAEVLRSALKGLQEITNEAYEELGSMRFRLGQHKS